jgi:hypothetical protein
MDAGIATGLAALSAMQHVLAPPVIVPLLGRRPARREALHYLPAVAAATFSAGRPSLIGASGLEQA